MVPGRPLQDAQLVERAGLPGPVPGLPRGGQGGLVQGGRLVPVTRANKKPLIAAGMAMACPGRPLAAAYPAAASRFARSASSQAAACPAVDSPGATAGGSPGGGRATAVFRVAMCWPAAAAVCR